MGKQITTEGSSTMQANTLTIPQIPVDVEAHLALDRALREGECEYEALGFVTSDTASRIAEASMECRGSDNA